MDEKKDFFAELKTALEQYVRNRLLLIRLQLAEKISKLVAGMFTGLLIAMLAFFILLFLSIMGGYYFAYLTGSLYWGFGIIAGFYIILLILIILFRKKVLEKNIVNMVIEVLLEKTDNEDESQ
jgi:hypothetical protein